MDSVMVKIPKNFSEEGKQELENRVKKNLSENRGNREGKVDTLEAKTYETHSINVQKRTFEVQ